MSDIIRTEAPEFGRDKRSGAILNTDINAYKAYKQKRESQDQHVKMQQEIDTVKTDIDEIKSMLQLLIKKLT